MEVKQHCLKDTPSVKGEERPLNTPPIGDETGSLPPPSRKLVRSRLASHRVLANLYIA